MNKYSLLLFISFLPILFFNARAIQITTNPVPIIDKLPTNTVQRIIQDRDGFLWLGTVDGVCRYDGYNVQVFRSNMYTPGLLTNNEVTCLTEDHENNIWIGTKSGINILNRDNFRITPLDNPIVSKKNIQSLLCSSDGSVWIGVDNAVYRYNSKTRSIETLMDKYIYKGGINTMYEDHVGSVWVLMWENGIHRFKKDGTITHFPIIGEKNNPFRIYQDNKEQYWVCTWDDGVFRFYPNSDNNTIYRKQKIINKKNSIDNSFFGIVQDNIAGYLWFLSHSGIYALQYSDDLSVRQIDVSYLFEGYNKIFSEIMKDHNGNLWIAAYDEGIFSINFDKPQILNIPLTEVKTQTGITPNITAIIKDSDDVFWLNQNRVGLYFYDINKKKSTHYQDVKGLNDIQQLRNVQCIAETGKNIFWLGIKRESAIYVLKKTEQSVSLIEKIDLKKIFGTNNSGINNIYKDKSSNIWITTNNSILVKPYFQDSIILFSDELKNITCITESTDNSLWMSSSDNGIYHVKYQLGTTNKVKIKNFNKSDNPAIEDNVSTIDCDHDGNIWIGTKNGNVLLHNHTTNSFEDYTNTCNLTGEAILDIIIDKNNNVWISTNKRVVEFNKSIGASRDYTQSDGIRVNSIRQAAYFYDIPNNILYFGGNNGICGIPAYGLNTKKDNVTRAIISDVKINGKSLSSTPNNEKFSAVTQKLHLSPKDKNIEIDFTSLNYTFSKKIVYAYKMEGIDDDWIYTNRQFATYNQLKKGKHVFHVKASDENRIFSEEVSSFIIYKQPAFYETGWAYIVYLLLFIGLSYWIYVTMKNRIQLKHKLQIAQIEKNKSEELTQAKLRYFTNISHDFMTPLTIISCLVDDIETVFALHISQFDMMRANVNRLRRLLQQVLDFRKMESGNMRLRIAQGDIANFVKDIYLNNFTPLFEKKKVRFTFETSSESIKAYFDFDKIDKIVYNLLSNALKYTHEGGDISLIVKEYDDNGINFVSISVKDTGIGIPKENLKNIFTRFYNNRNIETSQTNGIGLSLTHDLVQLHHGTITVESVLNEGSTFNVSFPIDKMAFSIAELDEHLLEINNDEDVQANEDSIQQNDSDKKSEVAIKEDINLLIVEDNEDILYTLKRILEKRYNVLTAANGAIALNIVKGNDIDLIISDVMMPEMDGLTFCRKIKENIDTSHIPILLLTAKNSVEDRIECYDAGANGYISKPFDFKLLQSRISNFISNKQKKQSEFKSNIEINLSTFDYPSPEKDFLNKSIKTIEENLSDSEFDIDSFAMQMNMSKSSLYRKIKTMTSLPPNEFIRNIRLKHAAQLLKDKSRTVADAAYSVGFTDPGYFATCFKSIFEMTPTEYQKSKQN